MPEQGKKSLVIAKETHHRIKLENARTGIEMYELVERAWKLYEAQGKHMVWPAPKDEPGHAELRQLKAADNDRDYKWALGMLKRLAHLLERERREE